MYRPRLQYTATDAAIGGVTTLLAKGERTAIMDKDNNPLLKVHVGAGWDLNRVPSGQTYDLDLFAICLGADKKLVNPTNLHADVAYYGNKNLPGIQCGADNLTGAGDGDDENIQIDLSAVPANVHEIVIGMNIYNSESKGHQHFGNVDNAFVRIADQASAAVDIKKFNLTEDFSANNGILCAAFYRHENGWKFRAIGEGCNGSIQAIADKYK